ncbi:DapH/DapD/GlmU-related protein [Aeromonas veronii]|uniref:DapH/DapD/GlmU-related protein n=1 Tax=Aeromonas veronii TaxID=654 RepID=UPI00300790F5
MEQIKKHTVLGLYRLFRDVVLTRLFYPRFRILRYPFYFTGCRYFKIGKGFTSGVGLRIDCIKTDIYTPKLKIGERCQVNDYVHIGCINSVIIGDDVLIASKVFITDHNHGSFPDEHEISLPPISRKLTSEPVIIGDKVWLGEGVLVLSGTKIGNGSIIGAGAVVTKDIPEYSIAVGNPAKVIKTYDFNTSTWISIK